MRIKGEFRDVLIGNGKIDDRGWKSNEIKPDFGRFLAAVMKKDFADASVPTKPVPVGIGIDYIAVGRSGNKTFESFCDMVESFFNQPNFDPEKMPSEPAFDPIDKTIWVWAQKIEHVSYVTGGGMDVTNKLRIDVTFDDTRPTSSEPLKFEEFSLLGFYKPGTTSDPLTKLFFLNYATHGQITKEAGMTITRTINLTFNLTFP